MRTSAKLGLTALIAALLLSAAVSTASARILSVSNQNIRVVWSRLEFVGGVTVRCRVTLEGSFHRATIPKVEKTLAGAVTRVTVETANCTGANAVTAEGLPWHITYDGFAGTLPRITEVFLLLRNTLFNLGRIGGGALECRFGTAADNITGKGFVNGTGEVTNLIPVEGRNTATLLEHRNDIFNLCGPGATGRLVAGTTDGLVTLLGNNNRIRVTLI